MNDTSEVAAIFNQGCEARLAGISDADNPYTKGDSFQYAWGRGWLDVHNAWGKDVRGRWPVKPLPPLRPPTPKNGFR